MKGTTRGGAAVAVLLGLLGLLAPRARAVETPPMEVRWSEDWTALEDIGGRRLATGERHARLETPWRRQARDAGAPPGLRLALRGPGCDWLLQGDGAWRRLGELGWDGAWQAGGPPLDAVRRLGRSDGAWVLEERRLLRIVLRGDRPRLAEVRDLPAAGGPAELRTSPAGDWLRRGGRLESLDDGAVLSWPGDWQAWAVRGGRPLGLVAGRGLVDGAGGLRLPGAWRSLRALPGELWVESLDGRWWRWPEDGEPEALGAPPHAGEAGWSGRPVAAGWLSQSAERRELWTRSGAAWRLEAVWPRPARLRDRQARSTCDWRLAGDGEIWRRDGDGARLVERRPGALGWAFAGGGPLLAEEGGLRAWSLGGRWLGDAPRPGLRAWTAFEDWLLGADEDSLVVWWTGEETPWRQAALPLSGASLLHGDGRFAVALAGGRLRLFDVAAPWLPVELDELPAPPGASELRVIEERLLLADGAALEVLDLSGNRLEPWAGPHVAPPARWTARRGLDRLLLLEEDGRLRQARLEAGVPVRLEWELPLPLVGRLLTRGDSLWVLGEAGWLRLALPAEGGAGAARSPNARPMSATEAVAESALAWPNPCSGRVRLARPAGWDGEIRVALHDLLGRRLAEERLSPGRTEGALSLEGRPAGLYWLVFRGEDGDRLRLRILHLP